MDSCVWSCLGGKFTPASAGCGRPTRPKHVITTSIFQLPYGHNDPAIYADGVLRLAHAVGRILPEFTLRIFVDGSLVIPAVGIRPPSPRWLENMRKMANMSHVQLVYVACPGVFNKHTHGHYDLFGTILRFIPMFEDGPDTPIWLQAPAEGGMALSFDSDMPEPELNFYLNAFKEFADAPFDIFSIAAPCTDVPWNEGPKNGIYQILAGLFATRCRLPRIWLDEFMKIAENALQHPDDKTNLVARHASHVREFSRGAFHAYRQIEQQVSPFIYGIDEIFLNHFLRPKIVAWTRQTRMLQLIMNMLLRGVDAIIRIIENGGQVKLEDPKRQGSNVPEPVIEGPFILGNSHVQRILTVASEVVLDEPLYGPILDQTIASTLAKRIIAEMRRTMNHSYTLARAYCNPTHLQNEEYAKRIERMQEILVETVAAETDGAVPPNSFYKYMMDCWSGVRLMEPYTPVVHVLGNGESVRIELLEAERYGKREVLCPPRAPRRTFRRRNRHNKTRKRLNKK